VLKGGKYEKKQTKIKKEDWIKRELEITELTNQEKTFEIENEEFLSKLNEYNRGIDFDLHFGYQKRQIIPKGRC